MKISPKTILADLKLPFLDVVLDEIFYIPPQSLFPDLPAPPTTVAELAQRIQINEDRVVHLVREVWKQAQGVQLSQEEFDGMGPSAYFLVSTGSDPVPPGLSPRYNLNQRFLQDHMEELKAAPKTIVVSENVPQAFSAAMYLRSMGVDRAFFLAK
jgi:hypothetical protein